MKVKRTWSGFTTKTIIGRNAFFIDLDDENGVETKPQELAMTASHFNYIVINDANRGAVTEVNQLIKKILSLSYKTKIELNVDGTYMPPSAGSYERVIYNAYLKPEYTYEKRIIKWLKDASSNFIFTAYGEDNIEMINSFVHINEINKEKIYVLLASNDLSLLSLIKLAGYNVTFNMDCVIDNEGLM